MTIREVQESDGLRLVVVGRVDTLVCDELKDELIKATMTSKKIIVDMSQVEFISSAGLRALFVGQKAAAAKNEDLIIVNAGPYVREVFNVTGFDTILDIR